MEENSLEQLTELLQEASEKINITTQDADDTETLKNVLDEVQTVIIKLKRDYDGISNDTLNETLEDLECSVRSVQLQIDEASPPELLKEACDTLQLLVNNMSESQQVCVTEIEATEVSNKDILKKCSTETEDTIELLEKASLIEIKHDDDLHKLVASLNVLKDTIKTLKVSFTSNADVLIEKGVDIVQSLNILEDKVFSLEKDLSGANINEVVRDTILTAIHSVFGNISNMRGTIATIQKRYMFENYGRPSEILLKSIKNVVAICEIDGKNKNNWKTFSKTLRKVLNHFEDIKFYINLDKTARLPSDAAFTKIILKELEYNINDILLPQILVLGSDAINKVNEVVECIQKNMANIESSETLEVKEKIPILKEISALLFNVTEFIKVEKYKVPKQKMPNKEDIVEQRNEMATANNAKEEILKGEAVTERLVQNLIENIKDDESHRQEKIEKTITAVEHKPVVETGEVCKHTSEQINISKKMGKELLIQETSIESEIFQIASELISEITSNAIAQLQSLDGTEILEQQIKPESEQLTDESLLDKAMAEEKNAVVISSVEEESANKSEVLNLSEETIIPGTHLPSTENSENDENVLGKNKTEDQAKENIVSDNGQSKNIQKDLNESLETAKNEDSRNIQDRRIEDQKEMAADETNQKDTSELDMKKDTDSKEESDIFTEHGLQLQQELTKLERKEKGKSDEVEHIPKREETDETVALKDKKLQEKTKYLENLEEEQDVKAYVLSSTEVLSGQSGYPVVEIEKTETESLATQEVTEKEDSIRKEGENITEAQMTNFDVEINKLEKSTEGSPVFETTENQKKCKNAMEKKGEIDGEKFKDTSKKLDETDNVTKRGEESIDIKNEELIDNDNKEKQEMKAEKENCDLGDYETKGIETLVKIEEESAKRKDNVLVKKECKETQIKDTEEQAIVATLINKEVKEIDIRKETEGKEKIAVNEKNEDNVLPQRRTEDVETEATKAKTKEKEQLAENETMKDNVLVQKEFDNMEPNKSEEKGIVASLVDIEIKETEVQCKIEEEERVTKNKDEENNDNFVVQRVIEDKEVKKAEEKAIEMTSVDSEIRPIEALCKTEEKETVLESKHDKSKENVVLPKRIEDIEAKEAEEKAVKTTLTGNEIREIEALSETKGKETVAEYSDEKSKDNVSDQKGTSNREAKEVEEKVVETTLNDNKINLIKVPSQTEEKEAVEENADKKCEDNMLNQKETIDTETEGKIVEVTESDNKVKKIEALSSAEEKKTEVNADGNGCGDVFDQRKTTNMEAEKEIVRMATLTDNEISEIRALSKIEEKEADVKKKDNILVSKGTEDTELKEAECKAIDSTSPDTGREEIEALSKIKEKDQKAENKDEKRKDIVLVQSETEVTEAQRTEEKTTVATLFDKEKKESDTLGKTENNYVKKKGSALVQQEIECKEAEETEKKAIEAVMGKIIERGKFIAEESAKIEQKIVEVKAKQKHDEEAIEEKRELKEETNMDKLNEDTKETMVKIDNESKEPIIAMKKEKQEIKFQKETEMDEADFQLERQIEDSANKGDQDFETLTKNQNAKVDTKTKETGTEAEESVKDSKAMAVTGDDYAKVVRKSEKDDVVEARTRTKEENTEVIKETRGTTLKEKEPMDMSKDFTMQRQDEEEVNIKEQAGYEIAKRDEKYTATSATQEKPLVDDKAEEDQKKTKVKPKNETEPNEDRNKKEQKENNEAEIEAKDKKTQKEMKHAKTNVQKETEDIQGKIGDEEGKTEEETLKETNVTGVKPNVGCKEAKQEVKDGPSKVKKKKKAAEGTIQEERIKILTGIEQKAEKKDIKEEQKEVKEMGKIRTIDMEDETIEEKGETNNKTEADQGKVEVKVKKDMEKEKNEVNKIKETEAQDQTEECQENIEVEKEKELKVIAKDVTNNAKTQAEEEQKDDDLDLQDKKEDAEATHKVGIDLPTELLKSVTTREAEEDKDKLKEEFKEIDADDKKEYQDKKADTKVKEKDNEVNTENKEIEKDDKVVTKIKEMAIKEVDDPKSNAIETNNDKTATQQGKTNLETQVPKKTLKEEANIEKEEEKETDKNKKQDMKAKFNNQKKDNEAGIKVKREEAVTKTKKLIKDKEVKQINVKEGTEAKPGEEAEHLGVQTKKENNDFKMQKGKLEPEAESERRMEEEETSLPKESEEAEEHVMNEKKVTGDKDQIENKVTLPKEIEVMPGREKDEGIAFRKEIKEAKKEEVDAEAKMKEEKEKIQTISQSKIEQENSRFMKEKDVKKEKIGNEMTSTKENKESDNNAREVQKIAEVQDKKIIKEEDAVAGPESKEAEIKITEELKVTDVKDSEERDNTKIQKENVEEETGEAVTVSKEALEGKKPKIDKEKIVVEDASKDEKKKEKILVETVEGDGSKQKKEAKKVKAKTQKETNHAKADNKTDATVVRGLKEECEEDKSKKVGINDEAQAQDQKMNPQIESQRGMKEGSIGTRIEKKEAEKQSIEDTEDKEIKIMKEENQLEIMTRGENKMPHANEKNTIEEKTSTAKEEKEVKTEKEREDKTVKTVRKEDSIDIIEKENEEVDAKVKKQKTDIKVTVKKEKVEERKERRKVKDQKKEEANPEKENSIIDKESVESNNKKEKDETETKTKRSIEVQDARDKQEKEQLETKSKAEKPYLDTTSEKDQTEIATSIQREETTTRSEAEKKDENIKKNDRDVEVESTKETKESITKVKIEMEEEEDQNKIIEKKKKKEEKGQEVQGEKEKAEVKDKEDRGRVDEDTEGMEQEEAEVMKKEEESKSKAKIQQDKKDNSEKEKAKAKEEQTHVDILATKSMEDEEAKVTKKKGGSKMKAKKQKQEEAESKAKEDRERVNIQTIKSMEEEDAGVTEQKEELETKIKKEQQDLETRFEKENEKVEENATKTTEREEVNSRKQKKEVEPSKKTKILKEKPESDSIIKDTELTSKKRKKEEEARVKKDKDVTKDKGARQEKDVITTSIYKEIDDECEKGETSEIDTNITVKCDSDGKGGRHEDASKGMIEKQQICLDDTNFSIEPKSGKDENGEMELSRMEKDHYIKEYQYGPTKQKTEEKHKFVDHNHRDYNLEFLRPPGYREKTFESEKYSERETTSLGRYATIYKAQTIILDSQLRSSVPPASDRTESEKRVERHRSKALSEVRSLISERRSGLSRDLKRKPVFSTHLTDRTAVEGSRVKLTCSVLSSTDPKITWYKNGVILDNKLKYTTKFIDGLITLEVLNAVPSDSAEYSCTVENDNGTVNTSANLKVYPSFEASPIPPTFTRSIRGKITFWTVNELTLNKNIHLFLLDF